MATATFDGENKLVDVKAMLTKSLSQSWTKSRRRLVNGVNGLFAHDKWNFLWVSVAVALSVFLYLMVYHGSIASALVGFIYPAYATVAKAVWPPTTESAGDRNPAAGDRNPAASKTKWLVYWPTFAMVLMLESPIVFFVWCFAPIENNGTEFVYDFCAWLMEHYNRFVTNEPSKLKGVRLRHVDCISPKK